MKVNLFSDVSVGISISVGEFQFFKVKIYRSEQKRMHKFRNEGRKSCRYAFFGDFSIDLSLSGAPKN